jgi:hypothetical protein
MLQEGSQPCTLLSLTTQLLPPSGSPLFQRPLGPSPPALFPHMQYTSEELLCLTTFNPGKEYAVTSCIVNNAPYGDTFRLLVRQTLRAQHGTQTEVEVRMALVYIKSVNSIIRGFIDRGGCAWAGLGR